MRTRFDRGGAARAAGTTILALVTAPLAAIAPWSTPIPIVANVPLEMAQPLPGVDVGGTRMPVGILFVSAPKFQLGLIDPTGTGSMSFATIDAAGTNFALGTIGELATGQIGGSYVTSGFDLRFWTCSPPCNSVSTFPVETAQTWIDSSSASSGAEFLVGGLDNTTATYQIFASTNGSTWTPFRTIAPAGGIYRNFDGGERVALMTEAPGDTLVVGLNCVFFEIPVAGTATEKRIDCANGTTPLTNVLVATDVEDPLGQAGPLIENRFMIVDGVVWGVFTRRQDGMLYAVTYSPGGVPVVIPLGPAPPGPEFFGLTMAGLFHASRANHVSLFAGVGVNLEFVVDESPTLVVGRGPGPPEGLEGPIALAPSPPGCLGLECDQLWSTAFHVWFNLTEGSTSGVALSRKPLAWFEDGFETGNANRWSATAP